MAVGAERFRGLWEDEMFARQVQHRVLFGSSLQVLKRRLYPEIPDILTFRHRLLAPGGQEAASDRLGSTVRTVTVRCRSTPWSVPVSWVVDEFMRRFYIL